MVQPELIVFVGLPGSGKTTYYRKHFSATHEHISKDRLGRRCGKELRQQKLLQDALGHGRSVVVDNTNVRIGDRSTVVQIGREFDARIICYYFVNSLRTCLDRNKQRTGRARIPVRALLWKYSLLVPPMLSEGFDEIVTLVHA